MKNKILYLCLIGLLIGFSACTEEDDMLNPVQERENVHRKFSYPYTGHLNWRPYADYEKVIFKPEDLNNKISTFNKAVNGEITMPDMDIPSAIISMETHFNYGWLAKRNNVDYSTSYEPKTFSFTVPLKNSKVHGPDMKTGYLNMVRNISNVMGDKFMQACDLYVSAKTKNSITFSLDIRRYTYRMGNLVFRVLADPNNLPIIPDSVVSVWDSVNPEYEENARYYSFVNVSYYERPFLGLTVVVDTNVQGDSLQPVWESSVTVGAWRVLRFNAHSIRTQLVPNVIDALLTWKRAANISGLIDFADVELPITKVSQSIGSAKLHSYKLEISKIWYYLQVVQTMDQVPDVINCHFPCNLGGM